MRESFVMTENGISEDRLNNMSDNYLSDTATVGKAILRFRQSTKTAVICENRRISYCDLCSVGMRIANNLIVKGLKKGDRIALDMSRSEYYIYMLVGIALSGCVGVPINKAWSEKQKIHVMEDSKPSLVIRDEDALLLSAECACERRLPDVSGNDLYLIHYTSGSTGEPKGVCTFHSVVVNTSIVSKQNVRNLFTARHCDNQLIDVNFAYVAAIMYIMPALLNEKTIVLATDQETESFSLLGKCIKRNNVTHLFRPPTAFLRALEDPIFAGSVRNLRACSIGGELITSQTAELLSSYMPDATIFVTYGSTELLMVSGMKWKPGFNDHLGIPYENTELYVLNENGEPVPEGQTGELCIAGLSADIGCYWNESELTAKKYIYSERYGRLFRSGDRVKVEKDGELRILGRIDGMLKLHGQRIETEMIEKAFLSFTGIKEAAAAVIQYEKTQALVGYYTSIEPLPDEAALRRHLASELPYYMIPSYLMRLEKMPLNSNGKLNRKALPNIESKTREYAAPVTEREKTVCRAFKETLRLSAEIGIYDSFFSLGGDSLAGLQLIAVLARLGFHAEMRWLFSSPSPAALAPLLIEVPLTEKAENHSSDYPVIMTSAQKVRAEKEIGSKNIECVYPIFDQTIAEKVTKRDPWIQFELRLFRIAHTDSETVADNVRDRFLLMIKQHPVFRSVFVIPNKESPVQVVLYDRKPDFFYSDRTADHEDGVLFSDKLKRYFGRIVLLDLQNNYDIERDQLLKVGVIRISYDMAILYFRNSRLLLDGRSASMAADKLLSSEEIISDSDVLRRHTQRLIFSDEEEAEEARNKHAISYNFITLPKPEKNEKASPYGESFTVGVREETLKYISDFCEAHSITKAALLHYWLGKTLCDLLGAEECMFYSVASGRQCDEMDSLGFYSHRVPFCFKKNNTLWECQEKLLTAESGIWRWENNGYSDHVFQKSGTVILDIRNSVSSDRSACGEKIPLNALLDNVSLETIYRHKLLDGKLTEDLIIYSSWEEKRLYYGVFDTSRYDRKFIKRMTERLTGEIYALIDDERFRKK